MNQLLEKLIPKVWVFLSSFLFLTNCSIIDQVIHPPEKTSSPPRPTYEQILKEDYKGPKARIVLTKFIDQSSREKEFSQVGDGIAEMLGNALLVTNRFIVQMRKSLEDIQRRGEIETADLMVEGTIREFKPGIVGAGEDRGGVSSVSLIVTVINPKTGQMLASEKVRGKAMDFEGSIGRGAGGLPEVFKHFSKTTMEKALRIAIEDLVSLIIDVTPLEYYRVSPIPPPQETPKPPPVTVQPEVTLPPQPPLTIPKPTLPVTQVIWSSVNLREGPGINYRVVGNIKRGATLVIVEDKGEWLRVRLEDGKEVWVSKSATSLAPKPPPSDTFTKPKPM
jgi:curli biogenesis system outer membrane secretion channel CsgG